MALPLYVRPGDRCRRQPPPKRPHQELRLLSSGLFQGEKPGHNRNAFWPFDGDKARLTAGRRSGFLEMQMRLRSGSHLFEGFAVPRQYKKLRMPAGGNTPGKYEKRHTLCRGNMRRADFQPEKLFQQHQRENNRWRACIGFKGKVYNLGTFKSYEEAVNARLKAEHEFYDAFLDQYREKTGGCLNTENSQSERKL